MDETDKNIIKELQLNGRISNEELAKRVNLSPSPCLRRVRALERDEVIVGYAAQVDQNKVDLPVTGFMRLRLNQHTEKAIKVFEQEIRDIPEVLECYLMSGDWDYLLRVIVGSLHEYEEFVRRKIHKVSGVASMDTSFAYGEVKRTAVYPLR